MGQSHVYADRLRLPLDFDPVRLRADLDALIDTPWTEHFVRQNYEGDWSVLPLRCTKGATHPVMQIYSDPNATDYEDTPLLGRSPYFREVLASLHCPLQAVRLMRLTPGSIIKEHRDNDLEAECGHARLHIPIVTNPDVDFRLNGTRIVLDPGSLWYLRLSDPHSVANRGSADRVHLVVDCGVNDWLSDLLATAA
ncbi:aspartyl/asparaginyl beta-hydroxylase domain-containing protein [Sphingomonas sp. MMS24-J45]|uniref:aspartyl/asparaginyl beta-hydroxylase domain-containing protein n=1 Tax=Sphingomonas sp. MMS24-J45 TaxID=3238806 RepID=UPI00384D43CA